MATIVAHDNNIMQYGSNCIFGGLGFLAQKYHPKTSLTFLFNNLAALVRHSKLTDAFSQA